MAKVVTKGKARVWLSVWLACLGLLGAICYPAEATINDPAPIIRELGATVLPGNPPHPFSLPDLEGNQKALADYNGQWIWLVFWATWCPVCQTEIPTLESLYQEYKNEGLTVIGVALDRNKQAINSFIKDKGITFPVLYDADGLVAGKYNASGVPMTYIISADHKVVGLTRGAVNWERKEILSKVKQLLSLQEVSVDATQTGEAAPLVNLPPPEIQLDAPLRELNAGEWLSFVVQVIWPGPSNSYLIKVPQLTLPEDVELGTIASKSSSFDGQSVLTYSFPLKFAKSGDYLLGPIDLSYKARGVPAASEQTTRNPGTTVTVIDKKLPALIWIGAVLTICLLVGGGVWLVRQKKRKKKGTSTQKSKSPIISANDWKKEYQQMKSLKIEGKVGEYTLALVDLAGRMGKEQPDLAQGKFAGDFLKRIEAEVNAIQYGGKTLAETELRRLEKIIEKVLNSNQEGD